MTSLSLLAGRTVDDCYRVLVARKSNFVACKQKTRWSDQRSLITTFVIRYPEKYGSWSLWKISKSHAHFQNKTKINGKFEKDSGKFVGEVAFKRYQVSICFSRVEQKITKFKLSSNCRKVTKIIWGLQSNLMHIFGPWQKNPAKFNKHPVKNCRRNCVHKTPSVYMFW